MNKVMETKEYKDAFVEKLKNGETRVYNKDQRGQIDNKKYLKEHKEDFLQPRDYMEKDYLKIYGKPKT
jgi:hypothetical protein